MGQHKGNHTFIKEFERIYLGVLNYYDIIISKLFRSDPVDVDDCLLLMKDKKKDIDIKVLENRFKETAFYDVSEDRMNNHFKSFLTALKKEGLLDEK